MGRVGRVALIATVVGCSFDTAGSGEVTGGQGEAQTGDVETSVTSADVTSGNESQGGTAAVTTDDGATGPVTTSSDTSATSDTTTSTTSNGSSGGVSASTGPTDACAEVTCDANATCDSGTGVAVCSCNDGFFGDGMICTALELSTLRVELPCVQPDQCGGVGCSMQETDEELGSLVGDPSVTYAVTLRFRGVIEQKSYLGGGTQVGFFHPNATPVVGGYNQFALEVDDPSGTYYLNSGTSGINNCFPLDEQHVVQVQGGSGLRLFANNGFDVCGVRNLDDQGTPIVVANIPPDPNAFDGQFIQVDVVDISPS